MAERVAADSPRGHIVLTSERRSTLLGLTATLVLALGLIAAGQRDDPLTHVANGLTVTAIIVAALPVYRRIRRSPTRRLTWSLLLAAELLTALAGVLYGSWPAGINPFSPPAGNLILAVLISALAAIFTGSITYASLRVLDTNMLIDALAGGLAISSVLAWLYVSRVLAPLGVSLNELSRSEHVIVGVLMVCVIVVVATAAVMVDVTGDRLLFYVAGGGLVISIGEVLAHHAEYHHLTNWGPGIDLSWIIAYTLAGRAAYLDDGRTSHRGSLRERAFAASEARKIAVFGLLSVLIICLAALYESPPFVGGLALAALVALLIRLLTTLHAERTNADLLEEISVTDPLTGLANRRALSIAGEDWTFPARGHQGGVVLIDLDNFKEVNDSLGHRAGDLVLTEVARRLRATLEPGLILARLGGDEFAIYSTQASPEYLENLAHRVEALVREPIPVEGLSLTLSASVGVATRSNISETQEELIREADVAMYQAKENHSGVRTYDFEHDRNDPRRLALYSKVSEAVHEGAIEVHLQPLVDVSRSSIAGCEALARWSPEGYGPIPPDRFVPMIELQGLIVPFTAHVLRTALGHVGRLNPSGFTHGLGVNVSERDFINADFPGVVARALGDFDFPAEQLTIEITEGVLANDDTRILQCIQDLREAGVRVSVDDFGTGYSALSKLVDFPVDEIKVDQSFVSRLLTHPKAAGVVRASVELARELDLLIVAEGVEDEPTYRRLVELGVDLIQGYYVARPMPVSDCADFIRTFQAPAMSVTQASSTPDA